MYDDDDDVSLSRTPYCILYFFFSSLIFFCPGTKFWECSVFSGVCHFVSCVSFCLEWGSVYRSMAPHDKAPSHPLSIIRTHCTGLTTLADNDIFTTVLCSTGLFVATSLSASVDKLPG